MENEWITQHTEKIGQNLIIFIIFIIQNKIINTRLF